MFPCSTQQVTQRLVLPHFTRTDVCHCLLSILVKSVYSVPLLYTYKVVKAKSTELGDLKYDCVTHSIH